MAITECEFEQLSMSCAAAELMRQYVHDVLTFGIGIKTGDIHRIEVCLPNRWLILGVHGLSLVQRDLITRFIDAFLCGWSLYVAPARFE